MVVIGDEVADLGLELTRQIIVLKQDAVLARTGSTPGRFFCPWIRFHIRLASEGRPAAQNAPVSQIVTLEAICIAT